MQKGGEGWHKPSQREEGSAESGVSRSACHHNGIKRERKKKKEIKENCKLFLVTILKRAKFWWEIGHKRCEEGGKKVGPLFASAA